MAAGKENLGSYTPKMVHAGDYPVVSDSGTVATGETIVELMPVVLGADGNFKAVTSDTIADVYGIAAEDKEEGEELVIYLTGQFFGDAIVVPAGTTAADFKTPFRKIGIFLVDTENTVSATKVTLATDSVGTAGDKKITGLTATTKYKITVNGATYAVNADGTVSSSTDVDFADITALTGTEITGLTNGTTYKVEAVTE